MRRALFLIPLLFACRKPPVGGAGGAMDAATELPVGAGVPPGTHSLLPARCHATDLGISVDDGGGLDDLEFGDAVATEDGYGVAMVRRTPRGRMAAVVLVRDGVAGARVVDLGPTLDEAPPPRLASCGKELVAAAYVLPGAVSRDSGGPSGHRDLVLYGVSHFPEPAILSILQHGGDSLGVDLACSGGGKGLAVWDETTNAPHGVAAQGPPAKGVVRAAAFDVEQREVRVVALSPPDSDAEMSRVVSNGGGFSVLWLTRRGEVAGPSDAASSRSVRDVGASTNIEIPGEPRAYAWLEMIAVDAAGNATGPVQRLTANSGHVSAYDVQALFGAQREILIVARDDGETVDGSGGTLLRVRALGDAVEPPLALASDGLGRGAPIIVDGPLPWLSWVGPREQLRLLPLDAKGDAVGPASAEEGLDEARPLVALPADGRMLVAAPKERSAQLRVFTCQR